MMMSTLEQARDALRACPTIVAAQAEPVPKGSCKVGIEANISPSSYPMIRVVPSRITPGKPYAGRSSETLLYFGTQTTNSQGLENVYDNLFTLEAEMLAVLKSLGARYIETITDEDRLDAYKLMVIRCELTEPPNAFVRASIYSQQTAIALVSSSVTVVSPFTAETLNSNAADWTLSVANGSISRLLNGATSTTTRLTASGSVAGANGLSVLVGIYQHGALIGNRVQVETTGIANPVPFTVEASGTDTATTVFDVRAQSSADDAFTFSTLTLSAAA